MNNVLVAPSVLSADFSKLKSELDSIASADYIHYDVMDGHFVPNISFGPDIFSYCKKSSELPIDVHLMVTNPATWTEKWWADRRHTTSVFSQPRKE